MDLCDELDAIFALPTMGNEDWKIAQRLGTDLTQAARFFVGRWLPEAAEEMAAARGRDHAAGAMMTDHTFQPAEFPQEEGPHLNGEQARRVATFRRDRDA
jgi:hypothetical protein